MRHLPLVINHTPAKMARIVALVLVGTLSYGCAFSERAAEKQAMDQVASAFVTGTDERLASCTLACPAISPIQTLDVGRVDSVLMARVKAADPACRAKQLSCITIDACVEAKIAKQTSDKDRMQYYMSQCLINLYKQDEVFKLAADNYAAAHQATIHTVQNDWLFAEVLAISVAGAPRTNNNVTVMPSAQ